MNQAEKAARFPQLHVKGAPLLLYDAWDAGSAKSIWTRAQRQSRPVAGLSQKRRAKPFLLPSSRRS